MTPTSTRLALGARQLGFVHGEVEQRVNGATLDVTHPDGTIVRFYHLEERTGFVGIASARGPARALRRADPHPPGWSIRRTGLSLRPPPGAFASGLGAQVVDDCEHAPVIVARHRQSEL